MFILIMWIGILAIAHPKRTNDGKKRKMKSHEEITEEIASLKDEIEANEASVKHAKQFPPGHETAIRIVDRCTANSLACRCRIDALEWVLSEG